MEIAISARELSAARMLTTPLTPLGYLAVNTNDSPQILSKRDAVLMDAVASMLEGQYDHAADYLQQLIKESPGDIYNYLALACIYEKSGSVDRAVETYGRALAIDPSCASAIIARAALSARARDQGEAEFGFQRAELLFSRTGNVRGQAEVLLEKGLFFARNHRLEEAQCSLNSARDIAERADLAEFVIRSCLYLRHVSELKMETVEARRFSETAYRVASLSKRWDCLSKTLIDIGEQLSRTNSANAISMLNEAQWVASKHSLDRLNERCFLLMARIHLVDRDLKAVELSLMQAIAVETSWSGGNPRAAKTSMILRIVGGEDPNATLVKLDNHLLGTA